MLNEKQETMCTESRWDFSDLKALFFNCTLKKTPTSSHTDGLIDVSREIFERNGMSVEVVRPVDYVLAPGVQPDMTKEGFDRDDWPDLYGKVLEADIVVITTPIWLGERSSTCTQLIERLYSNSGDMNDKGQWIYYGKVGGVLSTGNEDGGKHVAMSILYALSHLGFTVPPQADAYWVGPAGPGPSYMDEGSGGPENEFTQRNTTFLSWNLMHFARMLKDAGGVPAHGNQRSAWVAGCHPQNPNPEHR